MVSVVAATYYGYFLFQLITANPKTMKLKFKREYEKYPWIFATSIPAIFLLIGLISLCPFLILISLCTLYVWMMISYFFILE